MVYGLLLFMLKRPKIKVGTFEKYSFNVANRNICFLAKRKYNAT